MFYSLFIFNFSINKYTPSNYEHNNPSIIASSHPNTLSKLIILFRFLGTYPIFVWTNTPNHGKNWFGKAALNQPPKGALWGIPFLLLDEIPSLLSIPIASFFASTLKLASSPFLFTPTSYKRHRNYTKRWWIMKNWMKNRVMLTLQPREQKRNGSNKLLPQISQIWAPPFPAFGWGLSFKNITLALLITYVWTPLISKASSISATLTTSWYEDLLI